ncbi:unnamed protein product [Cuscuta campestris]|uniref:Reverse transcriptase domain-containing protein n=1 Tax=Cuscuta campestris TaxID=132261 RepID=A0A484KVF3_9ASTE|nr:unnamed protein product [Cuscuta campestris]
MHSNTHCKARIARLRIWKHRKAAWERDDPEETFSVDSANSICGTGVDIPPVDSARRDEEVMLSCAYYSGPVQEPSGSNGFSSGGPCAVPHGELEHVSVHTEASSFTPQQAPRKVVPGAGPVPEGVPINQPQFAANFMNFLQQMAGASSVATSSAPAASAPAAQPAQSQKYVAASSQPKLQASGGQAGKAPARTYVMRGRTEQPAHDVIMGMFTLFDTSITTLIDPDSTLSYVCMLMPVVPNIPREDLDDLVIVSNPLGHSLQLTHLYHDCPLVVQGKTFPASLIELAHREFDVILGMDWLIANQVIVDCGAHTVRLRAKDGSDILIRGELLPKAPEFISYIHARRLIHKKCEAFVCTVRDTR